jgi:hypothetical protein
MNKNKTIGAAKYLKKSDEQYIPFRAWMLHENGKKIE